MVDMQHIECKNHQKTSSNRRSVVPCKEIGVKESNVKILTGSSQSGRERTEHGIENTISERRLRWLGHLIQMDHQRIPQQALGGSGVQEGTKPAKDKLERRHQDRSSKNRTHLGRGGGSSPQQTSGVGMWPDAFTRSLVESSSISIRNRGRRERSW